MKRIFFGLFALAYQLEAKEVSIKDEDRPYSFRDEEEKQYIKRIDGPFDRLYAAITRYNLEAFKFLKDKDLLQEMLPPQIIKITDKEVVSVLKHVNPKHDYGKFISRLKQESASQVKVDLALASVLGVAGDLAPINIPESKGEVNAQVTKDGRVQILDIDDPGLEIEPMEFFLYGTNSFETALGFLKNPDLKAIALQRLKNIFPNKKDEDLDVIFNEKIELLQKVIKDKSISDFFQNPDNIDLIRQIQDPETSEEQQQKLQELEKKSPKTYNWLIEIQKFNNKFNQFVGNVVAESAYQITEDQHREL